MPVASSQYWNSIHGRTPGQASKDLEGLQTMRVLARNMTFLIKHSFKNHEVPVVFLITKSRYGRFWWQYVENRDDI